MSGGGQPVDTTQESIYSYVQDLFCSGIVIVVGSGASSGYGLPGMSALASYLIDTVPEKVAQLGSQCQAEWKLISIELAADVGLETALGSGHVSESLVDLITDLTANCIQQSEQVAIASILGASRVSSFGRLFEHILKATPVANVITTNYDRLIEVHAAKAGVRVDSMYYGHTVGRLDATLSREELFRAQTVAGRPLTTSLTPRSHIRLSKPHGSLDWFTHEGQHFRSDLSVPGARRIIAPGGDKYRLGYEAPFDAHRTRANNSIDSASAFLFVGYGFNDEHL